MSEQQSPYGDRPQPMTITEAWEKWKHIDHVLSDRAWLGDSPMQEILYDLWHAVKQGREMPPWWQVQGLTDMDKAAEEMIRIQNYNQKLRQLLDTAIQLLAAGAAPATSDM